MIHYASNQEVVEFFASHGIIASQVFRDGPVRRLKVQGRAMSLPMDASPDECLRIVREDIASHAAPGIAIEGSK